jgi:Family of unknown function (DUF6011)
MTLKSMLSKFAGRCTRCKGRIAEGTWIEWAKDQGAAHLDATICTTVLAAITGPPRPTLNLRDLVAFLEAAQARGLKRPKVRFLAPSGGELRLSLASAGTRRPGAVQVVIDTDWQGRIDPDGTVHGAKLLTDQVLLDLLVTIAGNPDEAARAYGALMGKCCYCGLPLTDAGSVEMGYGPRCAQKFGRPHQPKGTPVVKAVAS